jgi:hypothetical protein
MTQDGKQMSDAWILGSSRLAKAVGENEADEIEMAMQLRPAATAVYCSL